MLKKTRGIVLRAVKYSETSVIVDVFTEGFGLRSYIVRGVRQAKSKVAAGLLQVMSLVEIVGYDKPDKLNRLREIHAAHVFTRLPFEVPRSSVGLFMVEVTQRAVRETEENAELFQFLFDVFQFLDETETSFVNLHLAFLLELSAHLGFQPHDETNNQQPITNHQSTVFDLKNGIFTSETVGHPFFLTGKLTEILRGLLATDWRESHVIKMNRDDRRQLLAELVKFFQYHIDGFPELNSLKILQEIF